MRKEFTFESQDGLKIVTYKWAAKKPKAVVQIAHGAIEHAQRYDDFAKALVAQGFTVYANDHRGHGKTAGKVENVGYYSDQKGGFALAVEDAHALTQIIKKENPKLPVFLFGHSMGSWLSRVYAARYGSELSGLLLTGTNRASALLIGLVRSLAKVQMVLLGRKHRSPFLHALVFDALNKPFEGNKGCEFISTDQAVIDAYAKDEYCGNRVTVEFIYEMLWGTKHASSKKTYEGIRADLPIFIASGELDPVGGKNLAAVKKDVADFGGSSDVTFKVYENMRHEILNEKENEIVYQDIVRWVEERV